MDTITLRKTCPLPYQENKASSRMKFYNFLSSINNTENNLIFIDLFSGSFYLS